MFDAVRNNKRIIQIILALIILPFAFWGVESYFRSGPGGDAVATVGDSKITIAEFQRAYRQQQDNLRQSLGGDIDAAALDTPALRKAVLDNLVTRRVLAMHLAKAHLTFTDQQLIQYLSSIPLLQEDGKFSPQRYEQILARQGKNKAAFEAEERQDRVFQQALMAVGDGSMPGKTAFAGWLGTMLEQREITEATLPAERYLSKVKVAPEAIKAYYEANQKTFEIPERVRVDYVVLNLAEERRASHILIPLASDATPEQVAAAQAKAEDILAKAKAAPDDFAKLAKQYSADTGSAANGGDLDWFGRGAMVKPFEEAAFSIRSGLVAKPVRTDFGFHIIKVTGARPDSLPVADASPAQIADDFANLVYEQSDSLRPAAEKFKLSVGQSDWLTKGVPGNGPLGNAKLLKAIFAEDAIKNNRNTEAVEVAPSVLAAAHVVEHQPATVQPLETVAPTIEKLLAEQEAAKLAAQDGAEKLAQLAKGDKIQLNWSPARTVMRAQAPEMSAEALQAVFRADAKTLPAYVGIESGSGYSIYRIAQVRHYEDGMLKPEQTQGLRNQYARVVGETEMTAWLTALRTDYKVEINEKALETAGR